MRLHTDIHSWHTMDVTDLYNCDDIWKAPHGISLRCRAEQQLLPGDGSTWEVSSALGSWRGHHCNTFSVVFHYRVISYKYVLHFWWVRCVVAYSTMTFLGCHTYINEADWNWKCQSVKDKLEPSYTNRCLVGTTAQKRISKGDFISVWAHSVSEEDSGWKTNFAKGQD